VTRSFWLDQFGDGALPLMKCSSCIIRAPADTYQSSELRFRARVGEISVGLFQRAARDYASNASQEGISCKSRRLRSNAIGISWYRVILRTRSMHPEPYSRRYAGMPRRCRGSRQRQTAHKFFRLVVVALDSHCAVVATVQRMHVQRESMPRMPLRYFAQRRRRGQIATIDIVYEDGRGHQQNEARSRCGLTHRAGSDRSGA
jgi:hypothetical protein